MAHNYRIGCIAAAALAALAGPAPAADRLAGPVPAELVRVVDGDTYEVRVHVWLDQVLTVKVRLADVDTPELFRPACAAERAAAEAAAALVAAETAKGGLTLTDIAYGKYAGRVVAHVAAAPGRDLGAVLLAAGLAAPMDAPRDWCAAPRPAEPAS